MGEWEKSIFVTDTIMADDFDNPEIAKAALEDIMKAFPKAKMAEYFGDFNQIAVYLERRIREAKAQRGQ